MTHPDEQISREYREAMQDLARALDRIFNEEGKPKTTCFVVLIAPFNEESRVNYISNGQRKDIITMMKEFIARAEGQPELTGRA